MALVPPSSFGSGSGGGGAAAQGLLTTLVGAAATIDYPTIPATANVLRGYLYARGDTAANTVVVSVRFNADAGNNYDTGRAEVLSAAITATQSAPLSAGVVGTIPAATSTASFFGCLCIDIPFYSSTAGFHPYSAVGYGPRDNTANNQDAQFAGGVWLSAAAINEVTLLPNVGNFVTGSSLVWYLLT